jgi:hypothetical protein
LISESPLLAGIVQDTSASPADSFLAVTPVGGPGTPAIVTLFDGTEAGPVPLAFVAVTVKVYAEAPVRPLTVQLVSGSASDSSGTSVVQLCPPGEAVTVYRVIGSPPSLEGAVQETRASAPGSSVAVTPVGGPGTGGRVTEPDAAEDVPVPLAFAAVTVKV